MGNSRSLLWIGLLLVLILIGAGVFFLGSQKGPAEPTPIAPAPTPTQPLTQGVVRSASGWTNASDEVSAATELAQRFQAQFGAGDPEWIFFVSSPDYDENVLLRELRSKFGAEVRLHGLTDWHGAISDAGWKSNPSASILGLASERIDFGVGSVEIGEGGARAAGQQAIQAAIADAGKTAEEKPKLVIMSSVIGDEENTLLGIADIVGADVPVMGGSSGDNDVTGEWRQYANDTVYQNGLVLTVVYTDLKVGYQFSSGLGYLRTDKQGIVTKADGRTIYEINNRPATEVYNEWLGGELDEDLQSEEDLVNIVNRGIIDPLTVAVRGTTGIVYYLTVHPIFLQPKEQAIVSVARVDEGQEISIMKGSEEAHRLRIPLVVRQARAVGNIERDEVAAGIGFFCACTHMLLGDAGVSEIMPSVQEAFGDAPFAAAFTFGEQGPLPGIGNRHQNIITNVIVFGNN